jgi:20S proteasome alpha/beta subunit
MIRPFPKPPKEKPSRLPWRKAVTVVAGFKTTEGVVLCADTQETVGGISKRNIPKLRFEPSSLHHRISRHLTGEADELAVAFCGATDNGPYLDMLIDEAWEAVKDATSLLEACTLIKQSIKDTYREYGAIYQPGQLPNTEIIYGVKMEEHSKLFYAFGPAISETDRYISGGTGSYMAEFVSSRMYDQYLSIRQSIILAAYVLFQAKEHVDGCGGDSHIAVLRNKGTSGVVSWDNVKSATKLVEISDRKIGELLIHYADLGLTKEEFAKKTTEALEQLDSVREFEINKFRENRELWDSVFGIAIHDELGLPTPFGVTPSDDDKLESDK